MNAKIIGHIPLLQRLPRPAISDPLGKSIRMAIRKEKARKEKARQEADARKVASGRFNSIKGLDRLGR